MDSRICICCAGRMTAVSPRNPNLCLSCEQLAEDDSAELDRLLAATAGPEPASPDAPGQGADELVPAGPDGAPYSDGSSVKHSSFGAPA